MSFASYFSVVAQVWFRAIGNGQVCSLEYLTSPGISRSYTLAKEQERLKG